MPRHNYPIPSNYYITEFIICQEFFIKTLGLRFRAVSHGESRALRVGQFEEGDNQLPQFFALLRLLPFPWS